MELFTFLRIGASVERMVILPLAEDDQSEADAYSVASLRCLQFDVNECECFDLRDREHLLAKIESGFDDLSNFNRICAQALVHRLKMRSHDPTGSLAQASHHAFGPRGGVRGHQSNIWALRASSRPRGSRNSSRGSTASIQSNVV